METDGVYWEGKVGLCFDGGISSVERLKPEKTNEMYKPQCHNKLYVLENYFPIKIICRLSPILYELSQCLNIIIPLSCFYLCLFTTELRKDVSHLKELCRIKWDKSLYSLSQMSWRLSFSNKSNPLIIS